MSQKASVVGFVCYSFLILSSGRVGGLIVLRRLLTLLVLLRDFFLFLMLCLSSSDFLLPFSLGLLTETYERDLSNTE